MTTPRAIGAELENAWRARAFRNEAFFEAAQGALEQLFDSLSGGEAHFADLLAAPGRASRAEGGVWSRAYRGESAALDLGVLEPNHVIEAKGRPRCFALLEGSALLSRYAFVSAHEVNERLGIGRVEPVSHDLVEPATGPIPLWDDAHYLLQPAEPAICSAVVAESSLVTPAHPGEILGPPSLRRLRKSGPSPWRARLITGPLAALGPDAVERALPLFAERPAEEVPLLAQAVLSAGGAEQRSIVRQALGARFGTALGDRIEAACAAELARRRLRAAPVRDRSEWMARAGLLAGLSREEARERFDAKCAREGSEGLDLVAATSSLESALKRTEGGGTGDESAAAALGWDSWEL